MILQRYILRELIFSFLFAFSAVMGVCLVGMMFQLFRTFEGLGFMLLVKVLPLALGYVSMWALLGACCTAATLVYGRLSAENEIHAMQVTGIHANYIIAPALLFGLMLIGVAYWLNEDVIPYTRHQRRLSSRDAVLQMLRLPPPGERKFKLGRYRLSYMDYVNGEMKRPSLMKADEFGKPVFEYFAPSGSIRGDESPPKVILSKPRGREIDAKGNEHSFSAESDVVVPLEELDKILEAERQPEDMTGQELWRLIHATRDRKQRNSLLTIIHTRYAASLTPFFLVLVAVPIGVLVRRGSRLAGLGAALPPLLLYFVLFFIFQGLGDKSRINPYIAAYAPDGVLLGLVAGLMSVIYRK